MAQKGTCTYTPNGVRRACVDVTAPSSRTTVVVMTDTVTGSTDTELVHLSVSGGVATITLDSPGNRNALSAQLRSELRERLRTADADDEVRVVVLEHTGSVFCSGMDLRESRGAGADDQGVNEFPEILRQIIELDKPVVAKVGGPARAGGVGLVAACDLAVASDTATFAFTEVRIGVVPAVISVVVLPRIAPRAAQELFLTGEVFTAQRAAEVGLVNEAVPAEDLHDAVLHHATALAKGAPDALARTKRLLAEATYSLLPERFSEMLTLSAQMFASEQAQEGMAAFAEKRPPRWVPGGVDQSARTR